MSTVDVELLVQAAIVADRHGWAGPTIEDRRRNYAQRVADEYVRLVESKHDLVGSLVGRVDPPNDAPNPSEKGG